MFQRIRRHLTPSTAIAFVALVFAVTGGAFAATSHGGGAGSKPTASTNLATAAKSKTKAGARGPAGPKGATGATGPAGPAGPTGSAGLAGAAGAKGETGAAGSNGTNGTNGEKGEKGERGIQGNPGTNGTTGYVKELPADATETGTWSLSAVNPTAGTTTPGLAQISFPIPLATELVGAGAVHYVNQEGIEALPQENEGNKAIEGTSPSTVCLGTVEKPTAKPGNLCVYEESTNSLELAPPNKKVADVLIYPPDFDISDIEGNLVGAGTSGAILRFKVYQSPVVGGEGHGSWAVTAPVAS